MVKSFMAREGFTRMDWGPTLGLFKLRLSELWLLAHLEPKASALLPPSPLHRVAGVAPYPP